VVTRPRWVLVGRLLLAAALATVAAAAHAQDAAEAAEPEPLFLQIPAGPSRGTGAAPTRDAQRALREMEHELDGFVSRGATYRDAVRGMATRERDLRRGALSRDFARRVGVEEDLATTARDHAIELTERFVAAHPDHAEETPRAMLRLGELYYERAIARLDAALETDPDAVPDFAPILALYGELLERFPSYERRDAALYLVGHCLDRVGRSDEAAASWMRAVCPTLASDGRTCVAASDDRTLVAEMWLRIGEHEFDSGEEGANDRAIAAYLRALESPVERVRSLALYKLAWAYYRDGRYPEAIARFADVVEASDAQRARTGHAGSELRAEAIQYVALSLADRDWNADRVDDADEALPSPLARASDATLVPQDRPWTIEVLIALGLVAFDEGSYEDAITVLDDVVARWPLDHRVPATLVRIARAEERLGHADDARRTRALLGGYAEGSAWAAHNARQHPRAVDDAARFAHTVARTEALAEAIECHRSAQRAREAGRDASELAVSYACAVRGYRAYLEHHEDDVEAYDVSFDLGEALFWSGSYVEAAEAFARVRDSAIDDHLEAAAGRRVVEAYRRAMDAAHVTARTEPPSRGELPEVPSLVAEMARAREIYLSRIRPARDDEHVLEAYAFNQAVLLEQYGYVEHARTRFEALLATPGCGDVPASAYRALREIATRTENDAEAERLAIAYGARECSLTPALASGRGDECDTAACSTSAVCTARCDLQVFAYRRGLDAYARAEAATGAARARLYEEAATLLVRAVDDAPDHPGVPRALLVAGDALDRAELHASASRVYERLIEELSPRQAATPERQLEIDRALAVAWLALGHSAMRILDHERAEHAFATVASGDRFASSTDDEIVSARTNATIALAQIEEATGDYAAAADAYRRLARSSAATADEVRIASFEAAEMAYRRHDYDAGQREMAAFAARWPDDPEHTVLAHARIAESLRREHRDREERAALAEVIAAYERTGAVPGSVAATSAAEARVRLAHHEAETFSHFAITPGRPATFVAYVETLRRQIAEGAERARAASHAYDTVPSYGDARWTIAALVAQGEIDERLARGVLDAPFVMPAETARQLRRASPDVREATTAGIESRIASALDEQVRPIECRAIARYALASRIARRMSVDDEQARAAIDRLQAFGEERLAECLLAEHERDASFDAYVPGEFARARHGATAPSMVPGLAPPPLAD
jgi:tetratricopeptide (TPR) repeat protein